jgi:thiol-disulfide isomerase/thioredoxin
MFAKLCAIAVFALLATASPLAAEGYPHRFTPANPPTAVPDFVFQDAKGHELRLADFRGHTVLLNLWAVWCGPCVQEMPSLDRLQGEFKNQKLVVIALDSERNGAEIAASFFKRHEIKNLTLYTDPTGRISFLMHARALPMSFLINADGKLEGYVIGGVDWMAQDMAAFIRSRLVSGVPN